MELTPVIRRIVIPENYLSIYTRVTGDPNSLHTPSWRLVPHAGDLFEEAPVPGLMAASMLESIINEFIQQNFPDKNLKLRGISATFPNALYAGVDYDFEVALSSRQEDSITLVGDVLQRTGELKQNQFRVRADLTSLALPKEIDQETLKKITNWQKWFSAEIKLTPNNFLNYLISTQHYGSFEHSPAGKLFDELQTQAYVRQLINNEKIQEAWYGPLPKMFVVASTASQAMFKKFQEEANGKAYFRFVARFYNALHELNYINKIGQFAAAQEPITVFISDSVMNTNQRYEINIVGTLKGKILYTAYAVLVNLSQLTEAKEQREQKLAATQK